MDKNMVVTSVILTIAAVGQIVSAILFYDSGENSNLINAGWGVMMLSAIFGWLPIFTFRRKGKVEGRGYIRTTVLVDSGVYAIVRHPQYLAGILMNVALAMVSFHWLVVLLGLIAAPIYYLDTFQEEKGCIEKFGDDYRRYTQRVPRLNFILGIVRAFQRRRE